ncbi:MAG: amino acid adenylation domain-containing protein [Symploca sp. SIO1B1]|nr:amino acid adenylation domain-containing protein [Symploca sp. SIO1B1]
MIETPKTSNNVNELLTSKIYWLNQLSYELPETNLIPDYVRPIVYSGRNKLITFELPNEVSQAIIKFANNSYWSIYLVLVSSLYILFLKYTGNNDLIVGIPIYQTECIENLSNKTLPLRVNITKELTFKNLLIRVKNTILNAYNHQHYPLNELFNLLNIPESNDRNQIYDILIFLENIHNQSYSLDINNDLTISFVVNGDAIKGKIEYSESLFRDKTIEVLTKHYTNVIRCFTKNIHAEISNTVFLQESEKRQLLKEFNNNTKIYPINQTIQHLFEEQVLRTPNNIAVIYKQDKLTYQELNEKANKLANLLEKIGVKKGKFVGIHKERDANFLLSILAILKANGAYVPIDSAYPLERVKYMLSNSEVEIILTDSSNLNTLTDNLQDYRHLKCVICLDVNANNSDKVKQTSLSTYSQLDFHNLSQENLSQKNRGEVESGIDKAYMLYTSGSTGLPKGAIIRHDGAINHIYAQLEALELNEKFSFLQSAPASSDISVWQSLAPLLTGGRTVIVDKETVCSPEKLFKVIKEEKLTLVELVPVVLKGLLDYISKLSKDKRQLPDLKWMMVTGEYVSVELVNQWLSMYPSIKVTNAYGPTEAADDITQFIVEQPLPENQRTVPIGKPLANLNLYILDPQMQLVPIGVPGEICVSGIGVGDGYWKNEEKTNLSFVSNPFTSPNKPLPASNRDLIYKTGDLGRWLPDGNIEFLGRIDSQVKIRGFRIELGEIEALLAQHPAVRETAVVVRDDNPDDKRLVAYFVPFPETRVLPEDAETENSAITSELVPQLRNFLKEKLPKYMIPSAFILLEALPLTPSGKIDRRSLSLGLWTKKQGLRNHTSSLPIPQEIIEI